MIEFIFVFMAGDLEVRAIGDAEGHFALAYEMAEDREIDLDWVHVSGGVLGRASDGSLEVTFWRGVEDDEPVRLQLEDALAEWADEHGQRVTYPPEARLF
jgi:hypothetical protein